jgi:hypothetical protein
MAGQKQEKGQGFSKVPAPSETVQGSGLTPPDAASLLAKLEGKVKVIHGANDDIYDGLVGQKVSTVRASLVDSFNIPGDALALVNGQQVANDYTLQQNDVLEFIKQAGVKGLTP